MKNKKTNFIYKSCILIYLISLVYAFYLNWGGKYFSMTIVACLTPFIMPLLMKLLKIEVPQEFYIINIIFVYFASLWGSCLGVIIFHILISSPIFSVELFFVR
ncbi:MAG: hypothetical protein ACLSU6_17685 [Thomasclavelia ramosa]